MLADAGMVFNSDLTATTNPMRDILENTSNSGGLPTTGTKKDVVFTYYDLVEGTHGQSGYAQDAYTLRGR